MRRLALIIAVTLYSLSFASAQADEYVLEILFENGLAETTAVPGEIIRAELWVTIPSALGLNSYSASVGVEHTTPPAVIVGASGTLPDGFFGLGSNPNEINQPGDPGSDISPDGIARGFAAFSTLGRPGGILEGIVRIAVVDIQIPCVESLTISAVQLSGEGFGEYDTSLHQGTPELRSGLIRTKSAACDPVVLLGLSDSNIEMGDPVLLSWRLDRVHSCMAVGDWQATIEEDGGIQVRVTETSEFGLECLSDQDDQRVEASVTVEVFVPPSAHIRLDQPRVLPGETTTARWVTENTALCIARFGDDPNHEVEVIDNFTLMTVPGQIRTLAEILCDGDAGLDPVAAWAPIATTAQATSLRVEVDRILILEGEAVSVSWQSENASACWVELTQGFLSSSEIEHFEVAASGTLELMPLPTFTSRFHIDVGCGGVMSRTSITVRPIPAVELTAEFTEVTAGESVTLSWSSIDTLQCVALGAWSGERLMSGDFNVAPITDSVYEIGCVPRTFIDSSPSGALFATAHAEEMVRDSVTIRVIPEPKLALLQGISLWVIGVLLRRRRRAAQN